MLAGVRAVPSAPMANRTEHPTRVCRLVIAALAASALLSACSSSSGSGSGSGSTAAPSGTAADVANGPPTSAAPPGAASSLRPLHAVRGANARILDDQNSQVLLRGVNLNSLGDYYQPNASYPQTIPVTDADWARMQANGFDVVRLLVHWSALEPTRGTIDQAYIGRIQDAVDAAAAHGIYSVIDMHQDAFAKSVNTPADVTCPAGTKPNNGWDGAPAWATLTDGLDTCAPVGVRELAPAVNRAFENFYADKDGIQSELVKTWAAVAGHFSRQPAVAGYDLFNEPNWGADPPTSGARLGAFTAKTITAIRAAEQQGGGFSHTIFFEPVVVYPKAGTLVPATDITDDNVVFAPHNYNESINAGGTIESGFADAQTAADTYGTTFWIGEYGWFGEPAKNQAAVARYAAAEDKYRVGGTWWQWKQACGDPHSIGAREPKPSDLIYQFNLIGCPGDVDKGPVPEWQPILSRAYPRAAPGRIVNLVSDGLAGTFALTGERSDADAQARLDLWVPDGGRGTPVIGGTGVRNVRIQPGEGGYRVSADVCAAYSVQIGAGVAAADPAAACPTP